MSATLVPFAPSQAGRVFAQTDQERELLLLCRDVGTEPLLMAAREIAAALCPRPFDVWMRIARLHSGRQRTFWCDIHGTAWNTSQDEPRFGSIEDVRTMAEDLLNAYFESRKIEDVSPIVFESQSVRQHNGSLYFSHYARRGRHRVEVIGIPKRMDSSWATEGGAR